MKTLLAISILGLLCYYGVTYYNYINSGIIMVDPNLEILVDEWKSEMKEHGLPYEDSYARIRRIEIVNDYGVAGQCDHTNRIIKINSEQLLKGYHTTRVILWHELGHFVFDLDHADGIMKSHTYSEEVYKQNWEDMKVEYLNQIRNGL